MSNILTKLYEAKIANCPSWLPMNTHYLCMMGSVAYGVNTDHSDRDIYGWTIPKKEMVFPHLAGEVFGFGRQKERFEQYQEHHLFDTDKTEYDFSIFGIVKYFHLAMENNPNIIDSLFVPQDCVLHITAVGNMVRENRQMFLHKGCWPKLKGYAYSQLHKAAGKEREGKRKALHDQFGMDTKFLYHVVRLLNEAEQILTTGDLDLRLNNEQLKSIRRGEIPEQEIREWASNKEKQLEDVYHKSTLPWGPREDEIKQLLLNCLEHHYGSLDKCIVLEGREQKCLDEISMVMKKYGIV
jgi:predicted nucleotidyltransferase